MSIIKLEGYIPDEYELEYIKRGIFPKVYEKPNNDEKIRTKVKIVFNIMLNCINE